MEEPWRPAEPGLATLRRAPVRQEGRVSCLHETGSDARYLLPFTWHSPKWNSLNNSVPCRNQYSSAEFMISLQS